MKMDIWFAVCVSALVMAALAFDGLGTVSLKGAGEITNLVALVFSLATFTCMGGSVSKEGNWPWWAAAAGGLVASTMIIAGFFLRGGSPLTASVTCLVGLAVLVLLGVLCSWYRHAHTQEFSGKK